MKGRYVVIVERYDIKWKKRSDGYISGSVGGKEEIIARPYMHIRIGSKTGEESTCLLDLSVTICEIPSDYFAVLAGADDLAIVELKFENS